MKTIFHLVLLTLIVVSVASSGQKWTQEEKKNAEYFMKSLRLVIETHSISNKGGPGVISYEEFFKSLSLYHRALRESNLVRDDVLDKIHPELKKNYRLYFRKGIELRINARTNRKTYDEIQGSALMDLWEDWYEKNRSNIKIPR